MGLICEQLNCSPANLGFDMRDPRVGRGVRTLMRVYETVLSRKGAKITTDWDKENPGGVSLIHWALAGESVNPDPREVKFVVPQRPKGR